MDDLIELRKALIKRYQIPVTDVSRFGADALREMHALFEDLESQGIPVARLLGEWTDDGSTLPEFLAAASAVLPFSRQEHSLADYLAGGGASDLAMLHRVITEMDLSFRRIGNVGEDWLTGVMRNLCASVKTDEELRALLQDLDKKRKVRA